MHGGNIYGRDIKFDFSVNLNPCPCPEAVREALYKSLEHADRYPDIRQRAVRQAIARAEGVSADCVIGGNGASELILAIIRMLNPKTVLLPSPCFTGYSHALDSLTSCTIIEHKLRAEAGFALDAGIIQKITRDVSLLILTNPNNPTVRGIAPELLSEIVNKCAETGTALLADESFLKMSTGSVSLSNQIDNFDKLYIVSGYTKLFALPGVRIGYAISQTRNIERLTGFLPEWNMSVPAQEAACAAADVLADTDFLARTQETIAREHAYLTNELERLGLFVYPSDTCFLLVRGAKGLFEKLLADHILIRDCADYALPDAGFVRIAVKDHEANMALVRAVERILRT